MAPSLPPFLALFMRKQGRRTYDNGLSKQENRKDSPQKQQKRTGSPATVRINSLQVGPCAGQTPCDHEEQSKVRKHAYPVALQHDYKTARAIPFYERVRRDPRRKSTRENPQAVEPAS